MRQRFDSIGRCRREKYFKRLLKAYLMIAVPGSNEAKCFYFVSNHINDNRKGCLRLPMQLYRVSQKSCPDKFFEYLYYFIWHYQLFFSNDRGRRRVFIHTKKLQKSSPKVVLLIKMQKLSTFST